MSASTRTYRVCVGHAETEVTANSVSDAIEVARRAFCKEMPRLWDVISALEESRFDVTSIPDEEGVA